MNKVRKFDLKALAASAVLFAILQGLMSAEVIGPFWELNLILICMNVILASSLNMINGFTGQFSIGHAGFLAVGAYMGAVMTVKLGFSFPLAIVAGTVAAGFLGFLIGLPTLRLDGDYLAIATLGLGEIIRICILNIEYIGGASGLMGASFAGTAGVLFSHYFFIAHPASFTFMRSFDILTMVVLGGLGSLTGSITGAILLTFISAALADFPEWRMIIYSLAMIILMLYRPQGLFGNKELSEKVFNSLKGGKSNE